MAREYRMGKRADASSARRERIVRATIDLHDEKGVASTSFSDIARRAGVGQATVSRYFPTLEDIISACGVHVWVEMQPPTPEGAPAVFSGVTGTRARLGHLVDELDRFYTRGAHRLALASRDRDLLPQLDGFLKAVEAGVEALVREAVAGLGAPEKAIRLVTVMTSFCVWQQMRRIDLPADELRATKLDLLECTLRTASAGQ